MKTIEIKNVMKADLLGAELAEGCEYSLYDDMLYLWNDKTHKHKRFKGSYILLGKPDEISEDYAAELIPMHYDYQNTAAEYLIQALEKQVYWENPHGIWSGTDGRPNMIIDGAQFNSAIECYNFQQKWDKSQSRTFDRNRTLIFKKN